MDQIFVDRLKHSHPPPTPLFFIKKNSENKNLSRVTGQYIFREAAKYFFYRCIFLYYGSSIYILYYGWNETWSTNKRHKKNVYILSHEGMYNGGFSAYWLVL